MLCFIIPLKSKFVSRNWEQVCHIFEKTLRSIYHQIDPNFKVIVVCHELPTLKHKYDERVEFIQVNFPIPDRIVTKETMKDKWTKLTVGMIRAKELNPDFIMFVDADDLVSNRLSQYANSHREVNGWIFKIGYQYEYESKWIKINRNFNCGTNAIINTKLIDFPSTIEDSQECVILSNGHTVIEKKMKELNTPLESLPFPGAVYVCNHGDNDSHIFQRFRWYGWRYFLGGLRLQRLVTSEIRQEFSF